VDLIVSDDNLNVGQKFLLFIAVVFVIVVHLLVSLSSVFWQQKDGGHFPALSLFLSARYGNRFPALRLLPGLSSLEAYNRVSLPLKTLLERS
jgi:hypothetical protein